MFINGNRSFSGVLVVAAATEVEADATGAAAADALRFLAALEAAATEAEVEAD